MTDQEILIKILEDVVTTSKRRLLKTLDGELLKQPTEKLQRILWLFTKSEIRIRVNRWSKC